MAIEQRVRYRRSYNLTEAKTMSMYIDTALLQEIDRLARKHHMSRSDFVNRALDKVVQDIKAGKEVLNA